MTSALVHSVLTGHTKTEKFKRPVAKIPSGHHVTKKKKKKKKMPESSMRLIHA